jgi:UDP-N-acetylmuramyl pentapeptide synthase
MKLNFFANGYTTMDILQILVKAHLEGFGGVAGVIEGKSEMYRHLSLNDKFVL